MSEENPFRTLGFNPLAFKNLHDEEIFSLVRTQYRTLMQIHHPDVNRRRNAGEISAAISLAFAKVNFENDPASFNYWKEAFIKPKRARCEQSGHSLARLEIAEARESHLQEIIIECLKGVYLTKPVRPITTSFTISSPIATVNDGCAMILEDTIKSVWLSRERPKRRAQPTPQRMITKEAGCGVDQTIFELETTREGLLIYRRLIVHPLRSKDTSPASMGAWVKRDSRGIGYYWTTLPEKTRVVKARIVGSISSDNLRRFWDEIGFTTRRTIESGLTADETAVIESAGYTTDQVRPFLWLLKPELRIGNIVVSMSPSGDKFLFLGKLFMIADESKAPRL